MENEIKRLKENDPSLRDYVLHLENCMREKFKNETNADSNSYITLERYLQYIDNLQTNEELAPNSYVNWSWREKMYWDCNNQLRRFSEIELMKKCFVDSNHQDSWFWCSTPFITLLLILCGIIWFYN